MRNGIYRSTTMYKTSGVIKFQYGIKTKSRLVFSFVSNCGHCDVRYNFCIKTMVGSSFLPVVCRRYHDLSTLFCYFAHSVVQHIFALCLCFVSFSLSCEPYVGSFSGLSIFDCPFSIL